MTDNEIINELKDKQYINWKYVSNEIKTYLQNRFIDSNSLLESFIRLQYNIIEVPKCPICGKPLKYNNHRNPPFYTKYCSYKCSANSKETQYLKEQTKEQHFGNKNYNNRDKYKETCSKKYGEGIVNVWQVESIKEKSLNTKEKLYGNKYYNNREKVIKTNQEKIGVDFPFQSSYILNKCKETLINEYGVNNPMFLDINKEKIKATNIQKYGCSCVLHNDEIHKRIIQTNIEKYGDPIPVKTDKIKKKLSNTLRTPEVQAKILNTKKKNNSIGKLISKSEQNFINNLKEIFPDLVQQYFSPLYPYSCDAYIPSINTFIEYNEYWTHGKHPFDENNKEDIDKLNYWIENSDNHPQYKQAITTWTIRDVKKRKIVKENKLNYIEIWNKKEADELINKFKNEYR